MAHTTANVVSARWCSDTFTGEVRHTLYWTCIRRGPKAPVSWPPRSPDFNTNRLLFVRFYEEYCLRHHLWQQTATFITHTGCIKWHSWHNWCVWWLPSLVPKPRWWMCSCQWKAFQFFCFICNTKILLQSKISNLIDDEIPYRWNSMLCKCLQRYFRTYVQKPFLLALSS